jgi:hypothetical protein
VIVVAIVAIVVGGNLRPDREDDVIVCEVRHMGSEPTRSRWPGDLHSR